MATEDKFIVAIELGSSKVTGIAGRKQPDGATQILAFAQEPSTTFIRKGRINNVNKMTQCILNMKEKLEQKLQKSVSRVYVGIGGMGMHTVANTVVRHFDSKIEITQEMIDAMCDENRNSASTDRDILESVPQEYRLGTQIQTDPVGILADGIEGHFLNIVASSSVREEIRNCFRTAGVAIADLPITVQALADRYIVFRDDYGAISRLLLELIRAEALARGYQIITCPCAMHPEDQIDHLFIPSLRLAFLTDNPWHPVHISGVQAVRCTRFLDREHMAGFRARLRFNERAATELLDQAVALMAQAKSCHDELETYYRAAVDFAEVEKVTEETIKAML